VLSAAFSLSGFALAPRARIVADTPKILPEKKYPPLVATRAKPPTHRFSAVFLFLSRA